MCLDDQIARRIYCGRFDIYHSMTSSRTSRSLMTARSSRNSRFLEAGMKFVSEYRDEGFVSAEVTARELAEGLEVDRSYQEEGRRRDCFLMKLLTNLTNKQPKKFSDDSSSLP